MTLMISPGVNGPLGRVVVELKEMSHSPARYSEFERICRDLFKMHAVNLE
jgi:hypothetical protein